jgi:hypothetical protein
MYHKLPQKAALSLKSGWITAGSNRCLYDFYGILDLKRNAFYNFIIEKKRGGIMKAEAIRLQALQLAREENKRLEIGKKALEVANIPQVEYKKKKMELDREQEAIWDLLGRLN